MRSLGLIAGLLLVQGAFANERPDEESIVNAVLKTRSLAAGSGEKILVVSEWKSPRKGMQFATCVDYSIEMNRMMTTFWKLKREGLSASATDSVYMNICKANLAKIEKMKADLTRSTARKYEGPIEKLTEMTIDPQLGTLVPSNSDGHPITFLEPIFSADHRFAYVEVYRLSRGGDYYFLAETATGWKVEVAAAIPDLNFS